MMKVLDGLNKEQLEAVKYRGGPLLVLAGAGTGKTKVLTSRIAYMVEEGIKPENILAITFTNKAAKEMKERVHKLLGKNVNMQISTFHSFGALLLRIYHEEVGYKRNFTIYDRDDSLKQIKEILKEEGLHKKIKESEVLNEISKAKNNLFNAEEYALEVKGTSKEKISDIYTKYQNNLKTNNAVDFDDLLYMPYLILKNKKILKKVNEKYQYVLIDEYQDVNYAQYELTKLLVGKNNNICAVGDPDQSIYAFRGADSTNILNFDKDFKGTKIIKLEQNYRSTNKILGIANHVIKNNSNRKEKDLWSELGEGEEIELYEASDETDEAKFISKIIRNIIRNKSYNLNDIAVIYRTNMQSRTFEHVFSGEKVPYRLIGSYNFYSRKVVKDVLAYLRVVLNPEDDFSVLRVINVPSRGIGAKTLSLLQEKAGDSPLYYAIDGGKEQIFKDIIEKLKKMHEEKASLVDILKTLFDETGMLESLKNMEDEESTSELDILNELLNSVAMYEEEYSSDLEAYLDDVSLVSDKDDDLITEKINLMTVHSVKGLEFKCVFVTGLEENMFPHKRSIEESDEIEEERRLYYVAVTRAKEKLFLTYSKKRYTFGQIAFNPVSRFIKESGLIEEEDEESSNLLYELKIGSNNIDWSKPNKDANYQEKDIVYHKIFGIGKVLKVEKDTVVVRFDDKYGEKTLLKNHKFLTKYEEVKDE